MEGEQMNTYVVFWERMANSGHQIIKAPSAARAIDMLGFSPEFVQMTAFRLDMTDGIPEIKQVGERR